MNNKLFFLKLKRIVLMFFAFGFSQIKANELFNFYNDSSILYVIGEDHHRENAEIQCSIIDYLTDCTKIDNIIIEVPIEMGKVYDAYVSHSDIGYASFGDCQDFFKGDIKSNNLKICNYIKKVNENRDENNMIHIIGIDQQFFDKFKQKKKYLRVFFPELKKVNTPFLRKTIYSSFFRVSKAKTLLFREDFKNDIDQNLSLYQSFFGHRLKDLWRVVEQLSLSTEYSYDEQSIIREDFLRTQLLNVVSTNTKSVLICGFYHAIKKSEEKYTYDFLYSSMVATLSNKYPGQVFSILLEYYDGKKYAWFPPFHVLKDSIETYFENEDDKLKIVDDSNDNFLSYSKGYYDLVILLNCLKK
jgi:hypothetical protein